MNNLNAQSQSFNAHMDNIDRSGKITQDYILDRSVVRDTENGESATVSNGYADSLVRAQSRPVSGRPKPKSHSRQGLLIAKGRPSYFVATAAAQKRIHRLQTFDIRKLPRFGGVAEGPLQFASFHRMPSKPTDRGRWIAASCEINPILTHRRRNRFVARGWWFWEIAEHERVLSRVGSAEWMIESCTSKI